MLVFSRLTPVLMWHGKRCIMEESQRIPLKGGLGGWIKARSDYGCYWGFLCGLDWLCFAGVGQISVDGSVVVNQSGNHLQIENRLFRFRVHT